MTAPETLLLALIIIFSVPYFVWRVFALDAWAPLAIVQIMSGVVMGPGIFGAAFPSTFQAIFDASTITALGAIAQWAVMIFVFLAGCELDVQDAWKNRKDAMTTAGLALVAPMALGMAAAATLLASGKQWSGEMGAPWQMVTGTGMACAVTALPILVLLMQKLDVLRTPFGQRILRYASIDDVAIWVVLAVIVLDWQRLAWQALFIAIFIVSTPHYRRLVQKQTESNRWAISILWLLLCAWGADVAGLHFMVGAFLAGVVSERKWFSSQDFDNFRETILLTMMPVFFLSTGLKTTWQMGGFYILVAALVLLVASVAGKLLGVSIAGRILKWPAGEAGIVGWLLQTKALIMIIFANVLLDKHIISADLFTALLLMAVLSTLLTIPMVRVLKQRQAFK
jgi:Kef-type K+ transport system membrane component KefB